MNNTKYRRLAEMFQCGGNQNLKSLVSDIRAVLDQLPAETADALEHCIVEKLEKSLRDVFALEQAFEAALKVGEDL